MPEPSAWLKDRGPAELVEALIVTTPFLACWWMAAKDPGDAAGAPTPGATVATALGLAPVLRWLTRTAPTAPPATLPMTSPAASMAPAMLRAGRWGKEGTG